MAADSVTVIRPIRLPSGAHPEIELKPFPLQIPHPAELTVVEGQHPLTFEHPPAHALTTDDPLDILELLEYGGIRYLSPTCEAADHGVRLFTAARTFALDHAPEWIGFDWDYTTNIYKIYGPLLSLLSLKMFRYPPPSVQRKSLQLFEAAKPGVHELIMGFSVGYALRQGLRSFDQWEYYRPQVRWVTQTWPDRLALLGTGAIRIIPLMMGRLPGRPLREEDIRTSDAFITIDDFLDQIKRLLRRFRDGGYKFHVLAEREQDEVIEILKAGKGHKLKPLSTFTAKGWMPPQLMFDDSISSNARLLKEGVRVVGMLNPTTPGKEMSEIHAVNFMGRKAAAKQMVRMASRTEGPALVEALQRLAQGAREVNFTPRDLQPVPKGTILELHDISGSVTDVLIKFRKPQRKINHLIKAIIKHAGGLEYLERAYAHNAAMRKHNAISSKGGGQS